MVRAGLLLICFLLGFAGAALVGPRQLPVSPMGLRSRRRCLRGRARCSRLPGQWRQMPRASFYAQPCRGGARPRLDIARGLGLARDGGAALRFGCARAEAGISRLNRACGFALGRMAAQRSIRGCDLGGPSAIAGYSATFMRPFPPRSPNRAADGRLSGDRERHPQPGRSNARDDAGGGAGSQRASAAAELAVLKKALIESNNQSWRNQHLPVVASLSAASLARLRVHRAIRGRRDRVSLTAPPLTILLAGGPRPGAGRRAGSAICSRATSVVPFNRPRSTASTSTGSRGRASRSWRCRRLA